MIESKCSSHECEAVRATLQDYEKRRRFAAELTDEVLAWLFRTAWKAEALRFKQRCEYPDMVPFPVDLMHPVTKAMLVWDMPFDGKSAAERWFETAGRRFLECPARRAWIEAEKRARFAIWRVSARAAEEFSLQSIADCSEATILHADCPGEQFELGDIVFARVLELGGRQVLGEFAGEVVTGRDAREVLRALIAAPAEKRTDSVVAFEAFYIDSLPGECSWGDEEETETDGAA